MATAPKPSPARLAANRANAQKSTGPRTEAGKAKSRANAVKHGLTGAGVALPGEDAAAIEASFLQAQEEFAPTTLAGMRLVRDVAAIWVRQDRALRFETLVLDARARRAASDHDRARADRADGLVDAIEANPRAYRRALLLMPEGVDRLVEGLTMLLGELTGPVPSWSDAHHKRLDALFGYRVGDLPWARPTRFSRAVLGDYGAIGDAETAEVTPEELHPWAVARLIEAIGAEVAHLDEHRATLDPAWVAADRADAVALAQLDPGREGALAQRYISAAARDLSRALRDLHHVEARHGVAIEPEAEAEAEPAPIAEAEPAPIAEAEPTPAISPDVIGEERVAVPLASFGGVPSATPPAAVGFVPPAASHAIRLDHGAEPELYYPRVGG